MTQNTVVIRSLGLQHYLDIWQAMQQFTKLRDDETPDEIWALEHHPIFTLGQNGKLEHILNPGLISVLKVDRGGQVTYHGPGQLVVYTLIDLRRKKFNIRQLVNLLEQSVVQLLAEHKILANTDCHAPGVYIEQKKICSVGLRVSKGCSFHGLAFNLAMNLDPFSQINPCGYPNLKMTQFSEFHKVDVKLIELKLMDYLIQNLGYTNRNYQLEKWYGRKFD